MAMGWCDARARLTTGSRTLMTGKGRCIRVWLGGCWGRDGGVHAASRYSSSSSPMAGCVVRV